MSLSRLSCQICKKTFKNDHTLSTHSLKYHCSTQSSVLNVNSSNLTKFELARSILPISGQCPLCHIDFKGLRKHFNSCYFKSNEIKNVNSVKTSSSTAERCSHEDLSTKNTHKITKQCPHCKRNYLFKHKCQKLKSSNESNFITNSGIFNFSDDYWSENSFFNNLESNFSLNSAHKEFFDEFVNTHTDNFKILHLKRKLTFL